MKEERIRKIYSLFGDKISKDIFGNRVLYSLTGDTKYIRNIVCTLEKSKEMYQQMKTSSQKKIIFGAGSVGRRLVYIYNDIKFESIGMLPSDISKVAVTLEKSIYTYDGKPKTPSVIVKLDGKNLRPGTDYILTYSNNTKVGTATVTVIGKGNYTGSKLVNFVIKEAAGQGKPDGVITCKKTVYKVTYGAKTSGVATITIKAGKTSVKVAVKVNPKRQSVKSINTEKGRKLFIKWPRDKMASGYQVQVSTDKNFKKGVKSKNVSKPSYTFTKLKAGKKYYVRLRSYKKSGKETLYGAWSKIRQGGKIKK